MAFGLAAYVSRMGYPSTRKAGFPVLVRLSWAGFDPQSSYKRFSTYVMWVFLLFQASWHNQTLTVNCNDSSVYIRDSVGECVFALPQSPTDVAHACRADAPVVRADGTLGHARQATGQLDRDELGRAAANATTFQVGRHDAVMRRDRLVDTFNGDRRSRQVQIPVTRASAPPMGQAALRFLHEVLPANRMPTRGQRLQDRGIVLQDAGMNISPVLPPGLGPRPAVVGQQVVTNELQSLAGIDVARVAAPSIGFQAPHALGASELAAGRDLDGVQVDVTGQHPQVRLVLHKL